MTAHSIINSFIPSKVSAMFSKKENNIFGTVVFRLTLLYSLLLVVLSLVVFILIYVRLTSSLNHRLDKILIDDIKELGIPILEDISHAIGGYVEGKSVGTTGDVVLVSLDPENKLKKGFGKEGREY